MTGAQVATAAILAGFLLIGGIAAYAGAKIAARRDERRYSRESIYSEWVRRQELLKNAKNAKNAKENDNGKRNG